MIKNCLVCNKEFKTRNNKKVFCSPECRQSELGKKLIREKKEQTNLKKFGYKIPLHNKDLKEKAEKTNLEKYGVKNVAQSKEIQNKIKKTNLEKYGVECASQSEIVKKKQEQTMLKKYGCKTNLMTKETKEKIKKTNLEKLGVEYPMQNKEVLKKANLTNLEKYGVERPLQNKDIMNKMYKNNKKKYNVYNTGQLFINNSEYYNENYIKKHFIKDGYFLAEEFCNFFGITLINSCKRKKYFNITEPSKFSKTKTQIEIYDWIKSITTKQVILNDRSIIKPLELDIYIPEANLAIEYNGLLFHSYGLYPNFMNNADKENPYNMVNKTNLCEDKNIQLLHIFENEWLNPIKQEIWKSIIKSKLGLLEIKINARDCEIKILNNCDIKNFLEENHLQGYINSNINYGLFYKNELVSLLTFGKSRFNKNFDYELLRACTKKNILVRGGFQKLLNYFIENNNGSLISYGNRRWTFKNKNVYGTNLINISQPNYFYFNLEDLILKSRQQFQKHKLSNILKNFDNNLTETENMYINNYRKIYDCGNLLYKLV